MQTYQFSPVPILRNVVLQPEFNPLRIKNNIVWCYQTALGTFGVVLLKVNTNAGYTKALWLKRKVELMFQFRGKLDRIAIVCCSILR